MLSDRGIEEAISKGKIQVEPQVRQADIRPCGIRVHLKGQLLIPKPREVVDPTLRVRPEYETVSLGDEGHLLQPGMFALGATVQRIGTSDSIVGQLEGRSTIARLGLQIHCSSGILDSLSGDPRSIVLEMANLGAFSIKLTPNMPIGMVTFHLLSSPVKRRPQDQYTGQEGPVAPNLQFQPPPLKQ